MDDFRQGNIISLIEIFHGNRPNRELLERLYIGPHPSAANEYHVAHAQIIEKKADLVENKQYKLVSIVPSCGADLVAFAKEVRFSRR